MAQSEFDKQAEILKLLLEGIQTAHVSVFTYYLEFLSLKTRIEIVQNNFFIREMTFNLM